MQMQMWARQTLLSAQIAGNIPILFIHEPSWWPGMMSIASFQETPIQIYTTTLSPGLTLHFSNPSRMTSLFRSRPMNTILLCRFSLGSQFFPAQPSKTICTPCSSQASLGSGLALGPSAGLDRPSGIWGQPPIRVLMRGPGLCFCAM